MKSFSTLLSLLAILVVGPLVSSAQAKTVRVFIIGNSFSQNAARYLPEIVKEGGDELIVGRAELGGCSLQRHWEIAEAAEANPEDPKGKQYGGKSLRQKLSEGTWDIITLQQYSLLSSDVETYRPYAKKLYDYVKSIQPKAEVVMHQTWAYRSDAKNSGYINEKDKVRAKDQNEMWQRSRAAYHTIAGELGVRIIPVGDAFQKFNSDPQWAFKADTKFDFANPTAPNLPDQTGSLNVGYKWGTNDKGVNALGFDPNHANNAGCYLGGLMWYQFLFGVSPEKVKFVPAEVSPALAEHLRQVAVQSRDAGTK